MVKHRFLCTSKECNRVVYAPITGRQALCAECDSRMVATLESGVMQVIKEPRGDHGLEGFERDSYHLYDKVTDGKATWYRVYPGHSIIYGSDTDEFATVGVGNFGKYFAVVVDLRKLGELENRIFFRTGRFEPPQEGQWGMNDIQRAKIHALRHKHGEVWLGDVNQAVKGEYIRKWDGGMVFNFGATFAIPKYDAELDRLIKERAATPYTSTRDDYKRIEAINNRVADTLGGVLLYWV